MLALLLAFLRVPPTVETLNALLTARDVAGLQALVDTGKADPLKVIASNGAYDTGRFGWRAIETTDFLKRQFVVFSTPITSEDIGELLFERVGEKLVYIPESDDLGIRIVNHDLRATFSIPTKTAKLEDDVQLTRTTGTSTVSALRFSPCYRLEKFQDEAGKPLPFVQLGGVVLFERPRAAKFGLKLAYSGVVDLPQYAGSISDKEITLTNDYWYPMVARLPATYDLTVQSPNRWAVAGQGDLVSRVGGEWKFRMGLPVSYYSLSLGPYRTVETVISGRRLGVMSPRMTDEKMALQPRLYGPIIDYYVQSFGKWPFSRYTAVDSPAYGGGALESYSGATWGGGLPAEDSHEPAHTFWGGVIVNTYLKSFWNESFAVFCEGLFDRNVPIGNRDERRLAFVSSSTPAPDYNDVSCAEGGAFAGPVASSLGYGKGAKVLQMLEQILGTDATIAAMREWVTSHPAGQPGEWEDFERVCLGLNPKADLAPFFRDWLHRPGYAKLKVSDVSWDKATVRFRLDFDGPAFHLPLEVATVDAKGAIAYTTLRVNDSGVLSVSVSPTTTTLSIDPWNKALRSQTGSEIPQSVGRFAARAKVVLDPAHADYLSTMSSPTAVSTVPADLDGTFIIGHPDTLPVLKELCAKAGFRVVADKLTYRGTTIDLNAGAALALVDLGGGKRCAIGLGKTQLKPNLGRAIAGVTDELGRFLRGQTEPRTTGPLTFRR